MSQYVAAYDVSDDRQRERIARVLFRFGERIQKSVFVLWLTPEELPELKREVGVLLAKTDRFDLFPVDQRRSRSRVSWQRLPDNNAPVIVIEEM